jgi:hypothetical protein
MKIKIKRFWLQLFFKKHLMNNFKKILYFASLVSFGPHIFIFSQIIKTDFFFNKTKYQSNVKLSFFEITIILEKINKKIIKFISLRMQHKMMKLKKNFND